MFDWKIIIAVFLGIIALTTGLIESVLSGDIVERVKDVANKIIGKGTLPDLFSMPVSQNITISGELESTNYTFSLDNIQIKDVIINFKSQDSEIKIGSQRIDTSELDKSKLSLQDFNGKIQVQIGSSITKLSGKVSQSEINGISLFSKEKTSIQTGYVKFENLKLKDLGAKNLVLKELSGELTVKDKIVFKVEKEPIELSAYQGDISFLDNKIRFDGKVSKVLLNGEDIRSSVSS